MQHVAPLGLLAQSKHEDLSLNSKHNQSQATNTSSSSPQVRVAQGALSALSMSQNVSADPYSFMAEEMSILSPAGHSAAIDMPGTTSNASSYSPVPQAQGSAHCRDIVVTVAQKPSEIYSNIKEHQQSLTPNSEPHTDSHSTEIRMVGDASSQDSNKSNNFDLQQEKPGSGSQPKRRGRKKKLIEADNMQIDTAQPW